MVGVSASKGCNHALLRLQLWWDTSTTSQVPGNLEVVQIEWKDQRSWHITDREREKKQHKNPKKTVRNYFSTVTEPLKMNANENISVKDFLSISRLEAEGFDVPVRIIKQCLISAEFRKYCSCALCWWKAYTSCPISYTCFKVILSKCFLNSVEFLISLPCQRKIIDKNAAFSG